MKRGRNSYASSLPPDLATVLASQASDLQQVQGTTLHAQAKQMIYQSRATTAAVMGDGGRNGLVTSPAMRQMAPVLLACQSPAAGEGGSS